MFICPIEGLTRKVAYYRTGAALLWDNYPSDGYSGDSFVAIFKDHVVWAERSVLEPRRYVMQVTMSLKHKFGSDRDCARGHEDFKTFCERFNIDYTLMVTYMIGENWHRSDVRNLIWGLINSWKKEELSETNEILGSWGLNITLRNTIFQGRVWCVNGKIMPYDQVMWKIAPFIFENWHLVQDLMHKLGNVKEIFKS